MDGNIALLRRASVGVVLLTSGGWRMGTGAGVDGWGWGRAIALVQREKEDEFFILIRCIHSVQLFFFWMKDDAFSSENDAAFIPFRYKTKYLYLVVSVC